MRSDDKAYTFSTTNGVCRSLDTKDTLQALSVGPTISGWRYMTNSGESEIYNVIGHLLSITDENGNRFATYSYDIQGRAVSTEHAGGAGRVSLPNLIMTTPDS